MFRVDYLHTRSATMRRVITFVLQKSAHEVSAALWLSNEMTRQTSHVTSLLKDQYTECKYLQLKLSQIITIMGAALHDGT